MRNLINQSRQRDSHQAKISHKVRLIFVVTTLFSLLCYTQESFAITFTRIVDTNTIIPGTTQNYTNFAGPTIDSSGNIAFWGGDGSIPHAGNQGIFIKKIDGTLNAVAIRNVTSMPEAPLVGGNEQTFFRFGDANPVISNGSVVFQGHSVNIGGIYTNSGGTLSRVMDHQVDIPGGSGQFNVFGSQSINNTGAVVFVGGDNGSQQGVYSTVSGALDVVADLNTFIPDGSGNTFSALLSSFGAQSTPVISGNNVVFRGEGPSSQEGVYRYQGGVLTTIVDTNTVRPDTGTNVLNITDIDFDGTTTIFGMRDSGLPTVSSHIYRVDGIDIELVVEAGLLTPDTSLVDFMHSMAIDAGNIAFVGQYGSYRSIFAEFNNTLSKVIDTDDMLDGKSLSSLEFGEYGLSGNQIAFKARFDDGTMGIYTASIPATQPVPEPTTVALLGIGLAGLAGGAVRRRLKKTKQ